MRRTHQIVIFTICFAIGIVAQANFKFNIGWLTVGLLLILCILVGIFARRMLAIALIPLAFAFGCLYLTQYSNIHNANSIAAYVGQKVKVQGRVVAVPYWGTDGQYVITMSDLVVNDHPTGGRLRVKSLLSNAQEGFVIGTRGKLYHTAANADAQLIYADTRVLSTQKPRLVTIKNRFSRGLAAALPTPASQFIEGIVIGNRSGLPQPIQDDLNRAGLSHIVAVSGYNLTILIMLLSKFFKSRWKWLNYVGSLWLILAFVAITGAPASIVRAGVMSGLYLTVRFYGQRLSALSALALTILITLLINPSYIISDIGWQLSVAALSGIVLLAPSITTLLPKWNGLLAEIVATTMAALIFTWPIVAIYFGTFSLIAPLANLIIMPAIPALMAAGLAAGIFGMLLAPAAAALALPLNAACELVLGLIHRLAAIPYASVNVTKPTAWILLSYFSLVLVAIVVMRKQVSSAIMESTTTEQSQ